LNGHGAVFSLLDLSLDQLVEGLDVGGFCSGVRRIDLVIKVVFVEEDVDLGSLEFVMGPSVWPL